MVQGAKHPHHHGLGEDGLNKLLGGSRLDGQLSRRRAVCTPDKVMVMVKVEVGLKGEVKVVVKRFWGQACMATEPSACPPRPWRTV